MEPGEEPYDGEWVEPPPAAPRPTLSRTLRAAGLTVLALVVAGALLGVLWHFLAPTVPVINIGDGRIVVNDPSPEEYIAADGWFTLLGFGFGLLAAIAAWMLLRRHRGPWLLGAVTVGTLAGAVAAWQAGRLIGLSGYQDWRGSSVQAETFQAPPDLHAYGTLLIPAFAAVIVLTLLAGWSNDPNLDLPGGLPGYGRNRPAPGAAVDPDGAPEVSSGWPGEPGQTAEPAPPGPGPADPPRG